MGGGAVANSQFGGGGGGPKLLSRILRPKELCRAKGRFPAEAFGPWFVRAGQANSAAGDGNRPAPLRSVLAYVAACNNPQPNTAICTARDCDFSGRAIVSRDRGGQKVPLVLGVRIVRLPREKLIRAAIANLANGPTSLLKPCSMTPLGPDIRATALCLRIGPGLMSSGGLGTMQTLKVVRPTQTRFTKRLGEIRSVQAAGRANSMERLAGRSSTLGQVDSHAPNTRAIGPVGPSPSFLG